MLLFWNQYHKENDYPGIQLIRKEIKKVREDSLRLNTHVAVLRSFR